MAGEYSGAGGRAHKGLPKEVTTEFSIFMRTSVDRVMWFAFGIVQSRPRKILTVVTKSNAQRHGLVMSKEIADKISADLPDLTWDELLVDAMTVRKTL